MFSILRSLQTNCVIATFIAVLYLKIRKASIGKVMSIVFCRPEFMKNYTSICFFLRQEKMIVVSRWEVIGILRKFLSKKKDDDHGIIPRKDSWLFLICRCWVAAHMCVLSHFRTCDVRAEVRAERVLNCACGSACICAHFWLAIVIALFHLFIPILLSIILDIFITHTFLRIRLPVTPRCARHKANLGRPSSYIVHSM